MNSTKKVKQFIKSIKINKTPEYNLINEKIEELLDNKD